MEKRKTKILCKKSISFLLALLLVLTAIPLGGLTAFATTSGDFEYRVLSEEDKTCEITGYKGTAKSVDIPSKIGGYTVIGIGNWTFINCTTLMRVTIPDSVVYVGTGVFDGCTVLADIQVDADNPVFSSIDGVVFNKSQTILYEYPMGKTAKSYTVPDGVTTIAWLAFLSNTNLVSVTIPDSVTSIEEYAFMYCTALENITFGNGVTRIEMCAFSQCTALTSLTIPDSVTSIEFSAFIGCTSLTSVKISNNMTKLEESRFGYYVDYVDDANGTLKKVENFTIYGEKGSTAEIYAIENGFAFIPIQNIAVGDINNDSKITAVDARWALQAAAEIRTLTEAQKIAADVNGDASIDATDARWILQAAADLRTLPAA